MTDHFAVFGEPRRPWLDEGYLKEKFHRLSLNAHPDTRAEKATSGPDFTALNEAYQVLRDPKRRLQHLLLLQGIETSEAGQAIPAQFADLFWEVGALCRKLDEDLKKYQSAESSLARALLKPDLVQTEQAADAMLARMTASYDHAIVSLRELDGSWPLASSDQWAALAITYRNISYLARWMGQLQEKRFALASL